MINFFSKSVWWGVIQSAEFIMQIAVVVAYFPSYFTQIPCALLEYIDVTNRKQLLHDVLVYK